MRNYYSGVFEAIADCFAPKEFIRKQKTAKELLLDLKDRYTVNEISNSVALQFLYDYLNLHLNKELNPNEFAITLFKHYLSYDFPV